MRRMRSFVMMRRRFPGKEAEAIDHQIVGVAVRPVLAGLERLDRRMLGPVEMLRRMLIRRRVAAAHVTAAHAQPEVDPLATGLQTLLASPAARLDRRATGLAELLEIAADRFHETSLLPWASPSRSGRATRRP